ncbi:ALA-interacting subunit 3-like [Phalaenopsis equestris]|uniref:ALA-interacting subunit 3-like n=1 Tax=Phalaenopsis equestris TaxID=78828 RepID=UPI0009E3982E|nr:ALA-interacting subunit 3-like [Phalaenopsis equestris]
MMNSTSASPAEPTISVSGDGTDARRNSKRPKYSRFTQQELPACKPILTPQWVISIFTLVGIIFVPIGVAALLASNDVVEIVDRYETECIPKNISDKIGYIQNPAISKKCTRVLKVPKDMDKPVYVYYQLDNFYQNHRRYVKSRNDQQLRDKSKANETSGCDPEKTTANGMPIVPCGLIAWSLFNDTYNFTHSNGETLTVNKKDISWKSDRNHKFGSDVFPKNFQNGTLKGGKTLDPTVPLSKQEDLIVWMRTAALPTFRKLYGRIEVDLKENDTITVELENNYNTYSFGGKKKLVLSTTSWLGGKNDFLGIAYISIGGVCFFLATLFTIVYLVKPRKLGDPSYLSWNSNRLMQ